MSSSIGDVKHRLDEVELETNLVRDCAVAADTKSIISSR
jgi:hypothetical protein